MKLIALAALAACSLLAESPAAKVDPKDTPPVAKPTPITDPSERLKIFDIFAEGQKIQEKMQEIANDITTTQLGKERAELTKQANVIQEKINGLNAKIAETPLGKEIEELQSQGTVLQKKFVEASTPLLAAHGCPGGTIAASLDLKNCPAPSPVKVPEEKK